jgi:hypothetical protein
MSATSRCEPVPAVAVTALSSAVGSSASRRGAGRARVGAPYAGEVATRASVVPSSPCSLAAAAAAGRSATAVCEGWPAMRGPLAVGTLSRYTSIAATSSGRGGSPPAGATAGTQSARAASPAAVAEVRWTIAT